MKQLNTPDLNSQITGGLWKIASCACFAGINAAVRYLSCGTEFAPEVALPAYVIIFFQNVFGTLFMLPWIINSGMQGLRTSRKMLHILRVIIAAGGIGLWYCGLFYLPLAKAVALSFTGPIFTVLGASLFLKEKIDFNRGLAIFICFIGAYMLLRPDQAFFNSTDDGYSWAALFPLLSAVAFAASKLLSRVLAGNGESAESMTFYLLILMAPVSLVPAAFDWVTPTFQHWPWLILMGFFAAGAHYCLTRSLALSEVTFVMPFGYSKILISAALGFFIFDEAPKSWTMWLGSIIIFSSFLMLTLPGKSKKVKIQNA